MRINIVKSKNAEQVYVIHSFRKNGKNTTKIYKKLGTIQQLSEKLNMSRSEVIAWAKEQAAIITKQYNEENWITSAATSNAIINLILISSIFSAIPSIPVSFSLPASALLSLSLIPC